MCVDFVFCFRQKQAYEMRISDWSSDVCATDLSEDARAKARAVEVPLDDLNSVNWQEVTSLILSPGIPHSFPPPHPVVAEAKKHGVEIIGDIELLARAQRTASYVGITGTNGRSTEHTSELQSLMRLSYAGLCLTTNNYITPTASASNMIPL